MENRCNLREERPEQISDIGDVGNYPLALWYQRVFMGKSSSTKAPMFFDWKPASAM